MSLQRFDKISLKEDRQYAFNFPDNEIEKEWIEESEMRYELYRNGTVKGITLAEFEKRLK
ncbi:addiction module protein [candidate division KSB1 bacterium]|nr:addiction module protein [candidate division KSB1 bacterium]